MYNFRIKHDLNNVIITFLALYYDKQEIIPFLYGDYRYNKVGERIMKFSSLEVEVRALIEGQFIAKRAHAEDFGLHINKDTKILATGGASINKSILQVMSDVFNAPVYIQVSKILYFFLTQNNYGNFRSKPIRL